ncbi:MAG: RNA pyrophosphohydrolase [Spirochaetales bacterium]|nr:RNA pyrophosphohydrolase [Spirochaetales bacterium]
MKTDHQVFRAGVGAVINNGQGRLLVLERNDIKGAWQFPQGGLRQAEEPDRAVYREIQEETGLTQADIILLARASGLLAYELPPHCRTEKTGRGQVHYWYLFTLRADEIKITLGDKKEFKAWQWVSWDELLRLAVDFRKPVYKKLRQEFSGLIAEE